MTFEADFLFRGMQRWNLGWPTPNYAGAFLAVLLALGFAFSGSRGKWMVLLAEAGGLFLLAKTYSRGAVVAWVAAWAFGILAMRAWRDSGDPLQRTLWIARPLMLGVMLLIAGFGWSRAGNVGSVVGSGGGEQRENTGGTPVPVSEDARGVDTTGGAPVPLSEDGSVVNRLALWRGGLKMIAVAPGSGWGAGESGRAYMNWFQDMDRTEGFSTMVNSFLHVGVEYGLGALAVVLAALGWVLSLAWMGAREEFSETDSEGRERLRERGTRTRGARWALAAGASLVAWAVANVFTTLWIDWKLWVVPGGAALILLWMGVRQGWRMSVRRAALSAVASGLAVGALYGVGIWLSRVSAERVVPGAFGTVVVQRSATSAGGVGETWHVWPDATVLGASPGKELRRWLATRSGDARLVVHRAAAQAGEVPGRGEGVMLFGRQAERVASAGMSEAGAVWLIHPLVPVPPAAMSGKMAGDVGRVVSGGANVAVVLPEIDEAGNGAGWRAWAARVGARVVVSPGCGLDIRAAWPEVARAWVVGRGEKAAGN